MTTVQIDGRNTYPAELTESGRGWQVVATGRGAPPQFGDQPISVLIRRPDGSTITGTGLVSNTDMSGGDGGLTWRLTILSTKN